MQNVELLTPNQHKDVKIDASKMFSAEKNQFTTALFPHEFAYAQKEFPILFRKDPNTGGFYSSVLMGFEEQENLFYTDEWHASYIPAALGRGAFLIGFQEQGESKEKTPVVYIDVDHECVSKSNGVPLFDDQGGPTEFASGVSSHLLQIHTGIEEDARMLKMFTELKLIEPIKCDVTFSGGSSVSLQGIYGLNKQKLTGLSAEELFELNQKGYLECAFFAAASLANIATLIDMKNQKK